MTRERKSNASLMPSRCGTQIDVENCKWHVCGNISENIEAVMEGLTGSEKLRAVAPRKDVANNGTRDTAKPDTTARDSEKCALVAHGQLNQDNRAGELSRLKGPLSTCVWSVGHRKERTAHDRGEPDNKPQLNGRRPC